MGTTLTGTTPQDTYDSLIKVTDNGPLSGSLKTLTDGLGNDSALALSTGAASVTGTLEVSGDFSIADKIVHTGDTNTAIRFPAADTITFETSGAEAMRINSAGNVGIGTSTPAGYAARILDIGGAASVSVNFHTTGTGATQNDGVSMILASDNSLRLTNYETDGVIRLETQDTERVRITAAGVLQLAQGQIKFPATQVPSADANTLDDYEEGTWTMGVTFGGESTGVTYNFNSGTYTKIGRQVTVNGLVQLSNKGSSTGGVRITGLPFTIGGANGNYAPSSLRFKNISFLNVYQCYAEISTTTVVFEQVTNLGVVTGITDADFSNNSEIIISLTYFV